MTRLWRVISMLLLAVAALAPSLAPAQQEPKQPGWQTQFGTIPLPELPAQPAPQPPAGQLPNTTVVPRVPMQPKSRAAGADPGEVRLVAALTDDGQLIEQGLTWRIFQDKPGPDGKPRVISTHREPSPVLRLAPGNYLVNVVFGRAHLTRKITVGAPRAGPERFVLNAGGLRLTPVVGGGDALADRAFTIDIYSDDRDQHGQRTKVISDAKPGVILRLNAGIYGIVSTYGDANATVRVDVSVEAGKLTEATLNHAAAKVTFKLVTRPGGDAIADTQWAIATPTGQSVKESVGALPSHILAPGAYTVSARHAGREYERAFSVQAGQVVQVEVVMQ